MFAYSRLSSLDNIIYWLMYFMFRPAASTCKAGLPKQTAYYIMNYDIQNIVQSCYQDLTKELEFKSKTLINIGSQD